ncbi:MULTISPECIES: AI-2E family transporter [unclassified Meiothermus]|uniref:AI-2E family transporter n=1 Tax=unclassified Meiothermus TaxID=370471 RepID=UPI000D7C1F69|nr:MULTISPECIES: AI-2E family transporter [unclassified Meiothermus]PZA08883.1 AI-2E family transporter [Meiothermus sp. Pnk-1]RYM33750.1 AI-2E family transporter [Meiothermus sp. PNK-Is4]
MRATFRELWKNPWVRAAVYLGIGLLMLYLLLHLLSQARAAIVTLALGFGFAYLASPIVRWFERRKLPRWLGVLAVYAGLLVFLALASALLAEMVGRFSQIVGKLPATMGMALQWLHDTPANLGAIPLPEEVRSLLSEFGLNLQRILEGFGQSLLGTLQNLLSQGGRLVDFLIGLVGGVAQALVALVISIYLLYDLPRIASALLRLVPKPYQSRTLEIARKADVAFGGYIRGQLQVAFWVGLTIGVGLALVGVPLAGGLGLLAGVFNLIPYVGVIVSTVPALLLAATVGWPTVLLTLLVVWLTNQLEGHLLSPRILGSTTNLHPVTVIAAILIGASLFGLLGALLMVPTAAFAKILIQDYYLKSRLYEEG